MNVFKRWQERINLVIYDNKSRLRIVFRVLTFLAALLSLSLVVYNYGYDPPVDVKQNYITVIKVCFVIFFLNYLIKLITAPRRFPFFKQNWLESILMVLLVFDAISLYFFNAQVLKGLFRAMGVENYEPYYIIVIQLYILLLVIIELGSYAGKLLEIKIKPALMFITMYIGLILAGTGLLMMPEMTNGHQQLSFINALFTATSATSVTGLIVVDTATYFSFKGQFILLILIQLGGIGIITFASFLATFIKSGVGLQHQTMLQDFLSGESLLNARQLVKRVISYTFTFEAIGVIMMYLLWPSGMFESSGERLFHSIFHSISAFCNAGFALHTKGLMQGPLETSYVLHLSFAVLIIMGGLGFPALRDMFGMHALRERMRKPWKHWKTSTVVSVYSAGILVVGGAIIFFLTEQSTPVMEARSTFGQITTAIFQSVTARTAGFNTVEIGAVTVSAQILFIFLMFIGASSGSTGGGIKTSTFFLILLSVRNTIKGEKHLQFRRRTISYDLLNKAFSIFIFSASFVLIAVFTLSISEPKQKIMDITFETISAFSTTGLSTGITAALSTVGKSVIITAMILGKLGVLTLAFALSTRSKTTNYKYPNTHMMVG